jgi:acetyl esterase/lipase
MLPIRLAVAAAADPRISALVVFYGGIPDMVRDRLVRLPPLLALHGEADRIVPIAEGRELVERARALGGEAELIAYPGEGHGFDLALHSPIAEDARSRDRFSTVAAEDAAMNRLAPPGRVTQHRLDLLLNNWIRPRHRCAGAGPTYLAGCRRARL